MERHTSADPACGRFAALIHDRVDGALDAGAQPELDAHLASCAACRELLSDLDAIKRTAADIPDMTPRPEVWTTLSARLAAEAAARPRPFWTGARVVLAMAATLVVAVTSSVWLMRSPAPAAPAGAPAGAPAESQADAGTGVIQSGEDLVQDVDEHLRIADEHYVKAIAGLEQVVRSGEGALDPALAATLQKNLGVIDQAITESREAIKTQPNSQLAQTSLFEALRQKVSLLEDTVALINVMRKGDQAGAAKILGGLSKS
ncbi:MAG TPA: zf-HC2 domain-containing protein [Vicinamibacterales bacterium]|nr:zf-HC2 domain-containing protein [Vicinamibacterales bacterium]